MWKCINSPLITEGVLIPDDAQRWIYGQLCESKISNKCATMYLADKVQFLISSFPFNLKDRIGLGKLV